MTCETDSGTLLKTDKFAGSESAAGTGYLVTQVDGSTMAVTDSTSIDEQNTADIDAETVATETDTFPPLFIIEPVSNSTLIDEGPLAGNPVYF